MFKSLLGVFRHLFAAGTPTLKKDYLSNRNRIPV